MKKIYCSLLVVMFVLLSPLSAYASTTESMLVYAACDDEYAVMPLAFPSYENFYFQSGFFHPSSNSYNFSSQVLYPDVGGTVYSLGQDSSFDRFDDYPALRFTVSPSSSYSPGLSYNVNSSFRYLFSAAAFYQMYGNFDEYQYLTSSAQPFNAFATVTYGYNYEIYDEDKQTWYVRSGSQSEDVPLSVSLSPISNGDNVLSFIWDLSFQAGEPTFDKGDQVRNVSAYVRGIVMTIVYPSFGSMYYGSGVSDGNIISCLLNVEDAKLDFFYQSGGTSSSGNNISVGNAISSVSRQVSNLSVKLSTVQNSIETKIDTMGSNIVTGLNNVISSAQQNTQNIINTVTTKVDEVKTSVGEVKDAVVDLPNKLEEKAIGLVVPEEEVIADKFDDFTGTLEQELGILYEVPQMVYDLGDTITSNIAEPQKQMTFPAFSLSMPDGETYQIWGDIVFDIMPAGMEILQDFCMTITGLIMVTATVNAVKEQYELFIRDQKGR